MVCYNSPVGDHSKVILHTTCPVRARSTALVGDHTDRGSQGSQVLQAAEGMSGRTPRLYAVTEVY